ncbi:hypothetical protein [Streptococcus pluranimalium]|nr:hypothetical protein [Streptococcus suis]
MANFDELEQIFTVLDDEAAAKSIGGSNYVKKLVTHPGWKGFVNIANYVGNSIEGSYGAKTWSKNW